MFIIVSLIIFLCTFINPSTGYAQSAIITLTPQTQQLTLTHDAIITVGVDGVQNLGAYQFDLLYNPQQVTAHSATQGQFLSSTGRTIIPVGPVIDNDSGKVTIGAASFGNQTGASDSGTLATITFSGVGLGDSDITLSNITLLTTNSTPVPHTFTPATISVTAFSTTPTPTPTLSPSPTTNPTPLSETKIWLTNPPSLFVNTQTTTNIMLSSEKALSGVDIILTFDPQLVRIDNITNHSLLPITPFIESNNQSGIIRLSQLTEPNAPFTGEGMLATIHFTPLKQGSTSFTFLYNPGSKADTNAIEASTGQDILAQPSPLLIDIQDQAFLSLSLKTPSENSDYGHQITGTISDGSSFSNQINTDKEGVSNLIELPANMINQAKTFYLSVAGFLKKRIDRMITSGTNSIEVGLLIAGDLNNDGIINSLDLSILYDEWFTTLESGYATSDFNKDGITNSADHWHLVQNFLLTNE